MKIQTCPICGSTNFKMISKNNFFTHRQEQSLICYSCGREFIKPVEKVICKHCKCQTLKNLPNCTNCGKPLKDKNTNTILCAVGTVLASYIFLIYAFGNQNVEPNGNNQANVNNTIDSETKNSEDDVYLEAITIEDTTNAETASTEDKFLTELKTVLDATVAEKAYDILKNQIGFTDLSYKGQLGQTTNWQIVADGTTIVLTASDDVYRIFIPNSSFVFYENDAVKMTAADYNNKTISNNESISYYLMAQEIVSRYLKNPSSAKFPSIVTHPESIAMSKNNDIVAVKSYVNATNSLNATVKTEFLVEFRVKDINNYSYELLYINIGGQTAGTYVEL